MDTKGTKNHTVIYLGLIFALAIILRILCFGGFHGSDDGAYAELAHNMSIGQYFTAEYSGLPVYRVRLGVVAPVALGFQVFGISEAVVVAYPFLLSMLGIFLAFFSGRALFGIRGGLVAAFLMSIIPLDCRMASYLLPDLPGAFYANVGIFLLILTLPESKRGGSRFTLGLLAGLLVGMSWLCKVGVVYLFPFIYGFLIWLTFRRRGGFGALFSFTLAFLLVVLDECLFYRVETGDYFFRYNITQENFKLASMWFFGESTRFGWSPGHYMDALVKRILIDGPKIIFLDAQLGGIAITGTIAAIMGFSRRYRFLLFPGLWLLSLIFMYNFGSTGFRAYTPLPLFAKYLHSMLLPGVLATAGLLSGKTGGKGVIEKNLRGASPVVQAIAVLIFTVLCLNGFWANFLDGPQSRLEKAAAQIARPSDMVFADNRSINTLRFFWKYPSDMNVADFEGMRTADIPPGSYVLLDRYRLAFLMQFYDYQIPEFAGAVPSGWEMLLDMRDGELYRVPE